MKGPKKRLDATSSSITYLLVLQNTLEHLNLPKFIFN